MKLKEIVDIFSGIYAKDIPNGEVACLQVKDLLVPSPETVSSRTERTKKTDGYLLKRGDVLFAGKGTTYLCKLFEWDFPAVPSTTLYSMRLKSDLVTPEYLCWYLNHPSIVATVKTSQVGSATPLVRKPTLESLEIIVPSREKQRLVVELAALQKHESEILNAIAEKRMQLINQILINGLK